MSPAPLIHPKTETTTTAAKVNKNQPPPPPSPLLRTVNKDSHFIKKPSQQQQQQRQPPVIIYTHSPRIIHTDPRNFMELVQKLTGKQQHHDNDVVCDPPPPKLSSRDKEDDEPSWFAPAAIPEPPLIHFPAEFRCPNKPLLWSYADADPSLFDLRSREFREYQRS